MPRLGLDEHAADGHVASGRAPPAIVEMACNYFVHGDPLNKILGGPFPRLAHSAPS